MKQKLKKEFAVFGSVIIVFAVFNFLMIVGSENVYAANVDTCPITGDGNYCVEVDSGEGWSGYDGCDYGQGYTGSSRSDVPECKLGTCIPSGPGQCLANIEKIRCETENNGEFVEGEVPSQVTACQLGCCQQFSSSCSLEQRKVCEGDMNADYLWEVNDAQQCNLECSGAVLGCYKEGSSCEYGTLDSFIGETGFTASNFFDNTYCSKVVGCASFGEAKYYQSCGDGTTDGDVWDLYLFDSRGNREDLVEECSADNSKCEDSDGAKGEGGFCLTTNCVTDCEDCSPSDLRTGESVCVNVLGGFFKNSKRSMHLDNYRLNCNYGNVVPEYGDNDEGINREMRCYEEVDVDNENRVRAVFKDNKWENCITCGDNDDWAGGLDFDWNWLDFAGYAPGIGHLVGVVFGDMCRIDAPCSELGDCEYDNDLFTPLGSCNSIYPPGEGAEGYDNFEDYDTWYIEIPEDRCDLCGEGGDGFTNVCTVDECNSLGDCHFVEGNAGASIGTAGALAVGSLATCQATAWALQFVPVVGQGLFTAMEGICDAATTGYALTGQGLLYWGVVSLTYGIIAETSTQESSYELEDEILDGDKLKLGYALVTSKAFLDNMTSEEIEDLSSGFSVQSQGSELEGRLHQTPLLNFFTSFFIAPAVVAGFTSLPGAMTLTRFLIYLESFYTGRVTVYEGFTVTASQAGLANLGHIMAGAGLLSEFYFLEQSIRTGTCVAEDSAQAYYTNNARCGDCGSPEGQWYCTEERCEILGGNNDLCTWIAYEEEQPTGKEDGMCLSREQDDFNEPTVIKLEASFLGVESQIVSVPHTETGKNLEIDTVLGWEATQVEVKIETDQEGTCKLSKSPDTSYTSAEYSLEWGEDMKAHEGIVALNTGDKIAEDVNLFVKCKDFAENEIGQADDSNYIRFEFGEAPDEVPPEIDYISPLSSVMLPEGVSSVALQLYAYDSNGVKDCKYIKPDYSGLEDSGFDEDTPVEDVENELYANYDEMESFGTSATVTCTNLESDCSEYSKTFELTEDWGEIIEDPTGNKTSYDLQILCADNSDNIMYTPFLWSLVVWEGFNISVESPTEDEEIWGSKVDIAVNSERDAFCAYGLVNGGQSVDEGNMSNGFLDTYHTATVTDLEGIPTGEDYTLTVDCTDIAGNVATEEVNFKIFSDEVPPTLLRIWTSTNLLNIKLDESATCYYEEDSIDFEYGEGSQMIVSGQGTKHSVTVNEGVSYYGIKCRDEWENEVSFIVYP